MNIVKKLLVNSPNDFYNLIRDKNHIVEQSSDLVKFRDLMYLSIYGCDCDKGENLKKALIIYRNLHTLDSHIIEEIKKYTSSDKMIFNTSGVFLFEI